MSRDRVSRPNEKNTPRDTNGGRILPHRHDKREKAVGIKGGQGRGSGLGVDVRFQSVSNFGCEEVERKRQPVPRRRSPTPDRWPEASTGNFAETFRQF